MIKFEHSDLRAALRAHRRPAGLARRRFRPAGAPLSPCLDRGVHGRRALRGHGLQPRPGRRYRREKSAHRHAPSAGRPDHVAVRLGLHRLLVPGFHFRGQQIESSLPAAGARRARHRDVLFLHQAIHPVLAPRARLLPRHRAFGRLDRHARLARPAHSVAHRRRHPLDRRIRHDLRLPGLRLRRPQRPA